MRVHPFILATALVVAVACGGDPEPSDDATTPADAPTSEAAPSETAAEAAVITARDSFFRGPTEVAVGTTVTVDNVGQIPHTWTSKDAGFDSGRLEPGDTFEHTFEEAGTFDYVCTLHPDMKGTITVTG